MSTRDRVFIGEPPESGCNCEHLADGSTCYECSDMADIIVVTDGGRDVGGYQSDAIVGDESADVPTVDEPTDHLSATVEDRVADLEDRLDKRDDVATDLWAQLHDYQQLVEDLEDRVAELEDRLKEGS